jgi:hypothetical protein
MTAKVFEADFVLILVLLKVADEQQTESITIGSNYHID